MGRGPFARGPKRSVCSSRICCQVNCRRRPSVWLHEKLNQSPNLDLMIASAPISSLARAGTLGRPSPFEDFPAIPVDCWAACPVCALTNADLRRV
jgi:hypothetical protein